MQRLTQRTGGTVAYIGKHSRGGTELPETAATMRVAGTREVLDRLAEFEDIGLEPEQITHLLQTLHSQGILQYAN